jgi:hypothetical protein
MKIAQAKRRRKLIRSVQRMNLIIPLLRSPHPFKGDRSSGSAEGSYVGGAAAIKKGDQMAALSGSSVGLISRERVRGS